MLSNGKRDGPLDAAPLNGNGQVLANVEPRLFAHYLLESRSLVETLESLRLTRATGNLTISLLRGSVAGPVKLILEVTK